MAVVLYTSCQCFKPSNQVQGTSLRSYVRWIRYSNFGRSANYPDRGFSWFSTVSQKFLGHYRELGQNLFLPYPL
jgi:hypothetical protein